MYSHTQRPDWLLRSKLKAAQLQADALALRETTSVLREQTNSLHTEIVKANDRQRELVQAKTRFRSANDPAVAQINTQIADIAAELEVLNSGLEAAKQRHATATDASAIANRLANEAAKVMAAVTRTAPAFSGNGIGMSASSVSAGV